MKCGKTKHIECTYPFISLLTAEGLNTINYICHTHYTKGEIKNQIVIQRKQEDPEYWKRLMESNRGLEVNDDL